MHLVVVVASFRGGDATALASALMEDDRTATVWINSDGSSSRMVFDVDAATFEEAGSIASRLVLDATAGHMPSAEILSIGRPASADRLT